MVGFRTLLAGLALLIGTQSASACCLFPWFPGYAMGGWGWGGGGYAPPAYASMNYAPAYGYAAPTSYASYGGGSSCCATTVGYAGGISSGCSNCSVGCASNCCSSGCGSSGCGSAGCASSDCIGSEVRKAPVTDPNFNDVQDPDRRYELERERLRREMDELDELERKRRDRLKNYDDVSPLGNADEKPLDGFGRPSGGSSSTGEPAWDPTRPRPGDGSSTTPGDLPPFEYNNKPVIGDEAPDNEVIDRGANKPPMNVPLEEGSGSEAPGSETGAREFLGEEEASDDDQAARHRSFLTQRESRSSHFGVLSAKRLARGANSQPEDKPATQLSSGRSKTNAPLQWISLPAPTGRVRS